MSISTLILYGSCARQDNSASSDVDLFAVGNADDYRMVVASKVNLAVYSKESALRMSRSGDLFMLHIVREGRPIYDDRLLFRELAASFEFKSSYRREIANATELGWALLALASTTKNWALLNKRIAWCVRTVVIAQAADERKAIFSARELSEYGGHKAVGLLIENKDNSTRPRKALEMFEDFLRRHSPESPRQIAQQSLPDLLQRFRANGNAVGEKTIRALLGEVVSGSYT
jgi:predicted nucleotidyltransferase